MGVIDIIKAISEFGVLVVIAAIFLYVTWKNSEKQNDFTTQLFNTVIEQMKKCSGGHVLTEEEDRTAIKIDKTINELLQSAVSNLKASRIMVVRYHNGGKDMNSVSFLKLSVTNESVNHGYKPVMSEFQNQFRAIVGHPVNEIEKYGYTYVQNIEDIKDIDIGTYELLKSRNVRSYYSYKLTNATGYIVGAILVTYHNDNDNEENLELINKTLIHLSDQISGLLSVNTESK